MRRATGFVAAICFAAFAASPAQAVDIVRLAPFTPPIGEEIAYAVSIHSFGEYGHNSIVNIDSDFINRMTVNAKLPNGYRVLWAVSAEPPAGSSAQNAQYRETLSAYGVNAVTVETDASGYAVKLLDAEAIEQRVWRSIISMLTDAPPPRGSVLDTYLNTRAQQPLLAAFSIAPAALLAPQQQSGIPQEIEIGAVETNQQDLSAPDLPKADNAVPTTTTWTAQSWDSAARTITIVWTITKDEPELTRYYQQQIATSLADVIVTQGETPPERAAEFARASWSRRNISVLSLDSGMALSVEETLEIRIGPLVTRTVTKVVRQ